MNGIAILAFAAPVLDLDITLFIQTGIFVLVFLVLSKWVVKPYLAAIEERESMTEGVQREAKDMQERADAMRTKYEKQRHEVFTQAESARKAVIADANKKASARVEEARAKTTHEIVSKQEALEQAIADARKSADKEVEAMASQIANKLLI